MSAGPLIPFLDLKGINARDRDALIAAFARVLDSGWYILGQEVAAFEREFAAYCGVKHAVGTGNGLDALTLILRACRELGRLRPGDEVIVPANTYIASILAITENRLTPVLVEPDPATFNLDPARVAERISARTRAILAVHLYGQAADMTGLRAVAERHGLALLEDCAQAQGARHFGRCTGALGHAAGFSFFPSKNLGALGDAGAVTTDDDELAEAVRTIRNYGSKRKYENLYQGVNSRLDEVQAALLRVKLKRLDDDNERRRAVARRYLQGIANADLMLPATGAGNEHVWHLFVVRSASRDRLQAHLRERGVETLIHYPIPPHRQCAYADWNALSLPLTERIHEEVLSLPVSPVLDDASIDRVIGACNAWRP